MLPAPTTSAISTPRSCHLVHLARDALDALGIGAVLEAAHQGLAGELQQYAAECGFFGHGANIVCAIPPTTNLAKRAIRTFSPVFAASSARSSSIVLPS